MVAPLIALELVPVLNSNFIFTYLIKIYFQYYYYITSPFLLYKKIEILSLYWGLKFWIFQRVLKDELPIVLRN